MYFRMSFSILTKVSLGFFWGIALNWKICLYNVDFCDGCSWPSACFNLGHTSLQPVSGCGRRWLLFFAIDPPGTGKSTYSLALEFTLEFQHMLETS